MSEMVRDFLHKLFSACIDTPFFGNVHSIAAYKIRKRKDKTADYEPAPFCHRTDYRPAQSDGASISVL